MGKTKLPKDIDKETKLIIAELSSTDDKRDYVSKAYERVSRSYEAGRVKTFTRIWQLFGNGIDDLINRSGFMHCTNQNYVLANILVKSGLFSESDIKPRWTTIWYCTPHQYLEINLGDEKIIVDSWGRHYGIPFGSYAKGFNTSASKSFVEK